MKTKLILLFVFAMQISMQITAQDVIFKKNGEIIKTKVLNNAGSSISYRYYEQKDSIIYHITAASIDSIIYRNGTKDIFAKKNIDYVQTEENVVPLVYMHHLIGLDLAGVVWNNSLSLSYEYLPGKANFGFNVGFTKQLKTMYLYGSDYSSQNLNSISNWNFKIGANYYFYPPRTFRIGTGLQYVYGSYSQNTYNSLTSLNDISTKYVNGLLLNGFGFYNVTKNLAFSLGLNIPVFINPSIATGWIRIEIMYNF